MRLYISDLDGTLANSEKAISSRSQQVLNELIDQDIQFTIATARSYASLKDIIEPLKIKLPLILFNGALIYDPRKNKTILSNFLSRETAKEIIQSYEAHGITPIVYIINADGEDKVLYKGVFNKGEDDYMGDRIKNHDDRFVQVDNFYDYLDEQIVSINAINTDQTLASVYAKLKQNKEVICHYAEDIYSKYYWLEILDRNCTKGHAVKYLKEYLNASTLVCFGDQLNDRTMFECACERYAVANAHDDIKSLATNIILSNNEDGVAEFLYERYRKVNT